jgi:regulator of sigma E protease
MLIVLLVIIALSLLVLAHEAGHFFVAKAFGMKVDEFGFGFPPEMVGIPIEKLKLPPKIFSVRRYRGTNVVPIAVERETIDVTERDAAGSVVEEAIMVERAIDVDVPVTRWRFFWGEESSKDVEGLTPSDTVYSVNWLPFGGFVKIAGEADGLQEPSEASEEEKKHLYRFQAWWKRALVLSAGVIINFILGWLLLSTVLAVGTPQVLVVADVQAGSPAEQAGVKEGDIIKNFSASTPFIDFVNAHRGEEVTFNISRNGEGMEFKIIPRVKTSPGEGAIGVSLAEGGAVREGLFAALYHGFTLSVKIVGLTLAAFYNLIRNLLFHASLIEGVVGPIGIVSVASETSKLGFIFLLSIIAQISLSLAVVNFIPFPALDGGQFFLVIVEKIKGSPLFSKRVEGHLNAIGFISLIVLIVLITFRDISHLL